MVVASQTSSIDSFKRQALDMLRSEGQAYDTSQAFFVRLHASLVSVIREEQQLENSRTDRRPGTRGNNLRQGREQWKTNAPYSRSSGLLPEAAFRLFPPPPAAAVPVEPGGAFAAGTAAAAAAAA
jgi:hypothetical protein